MDEPNEFGFTKQQIRSADDEFHRQLGHTLTGWGGIEHELFNWFWRLSTISHGEIARQIFYSARSFQGRFDMLKVLLSAPTNSIFYASGEVEFLRAALKKIRQHSAFRNFIAHGLTVQVQNTNKVHMVSDGEVTAVSAEWLWGDEPGGGTTDFPTTVTLDHLRTAETNWYFIKHTLFGVRSPKNARYPATPQEGLARLALVPSGAHLAQPAQMPEAQKFPRPPSQG